MTTASSLSSLPSQTTRRNTTTIMGSSSSSDDTAGIGDSAVGVVERRLLMKPSITPILLNVVCFIGLICYHAHAESTESSSSSPNHSNVPTNNDSINATTTPNLSLWERITSGPANLTTMDKILFGVLVLLGMELLNYISSNLGYWFNAKQIPVRGKHLDVLSPTDQLFIAISKVQTAPFTYFFFRYAYYESNVVWYIQDVTIFNTILVLPLLYIVFDFFYTILHWFLHIKSIYGYIHKHHHSQKAPSRANIDAINVHPIEFFCGENLHLVSLYLVTHVFQLNVHVLGALIFVVCGGILAGLNHTRYDMVISTFGSGSGITLFDSKYHDIHHRFPTANYGQYTVFWDHIFGSFRPYDPNDRINPEAQIDPKTGKSLSYKNKEKEKVQ